MVARGGRWRARVADGLKRGHPDLYHELVGSLARVAASSVDKFAEVDKDIPRSFGTLPEEYRYPSAQDDMREVLLAYMLHRQDVGYCQGMSFLVIVMLGHMGKEDAFWLLVGIVEELPPDFYRNTALTECEILQGIVAERLPAFREHLGPQFPLAVNFLAVRWFITFFVHETPLETTLAVWDAFFRDGLPAIYRASLAMMELHSGPLLARFDELSHQLAAAEAGRAGVNGSQLEAMRRQHDTLSHMSFVKELSRLAETDANPRRLLARMRELEKVVTAEGIEERRSARSRGVSMRQRSLGARIAAALEDGGTACTMAQVEQLRFLCGELGDAALAVGRPEHAVGVEDARTAFSQAFPSWPHSGARQLLAAFPRAAALRREEPAAEESVWAALSVPDGCLDARALVAGMAFFLAGGVEEKMRAYSPRGTSEMPVDTATRMLNALRALAALWFDAYGIYERAGGHERVRSGALIDPRALVEDAGSDGPVGDGAGEQGAAASGDGAVGRGAPKVHTPSPFAATDVAREGSPGFADFGAVRRCVLADSVLVLCLRHRKPAKPDPIVRVADSSDEPAVDILRIFMQPIELFASASETRARRRGAGAAIVPDGGDVGLEPTDRRRRGGKGEAPADDAPSLLIACGGRRGRSGSGEADDSGCHLQ